MCRILITWPTTEIFGHLCKPLKRAYGLMESFTSLSTMCFQPAIQPELQVELTSEKSERTSIQHFLRSAEDAFNTYIYIYSSVWEFLLQKRFSVVRKLQDKPDGGNILYSRGLSVVKRFHPRQGQELVDFIRRNLET